MCQIFVIAFEIEFSKFHLSGQFWFNFLLLLEVLFR